MNIDSGLITVSIVSHGHGEAVGPLVTDLMNFPEVRSIVLTLNIPEAVATHLLAQEERLLILHNPHPKGFGANHNAAFTFCETPYFCVLNPDVRFEDNPFTTLVETSIAFNAALCGPAIKNSYGSIEDNARPFPTIMGLILKALGLSKERHLYQEGDKPFYPDWLAGMFMLFNANDFKAIGGFDRSFYLYYEDVDICARLWLSGRKVICCPIVSIVHDAQRASHRNLRHFFWHITSMMRYFSRYWGKTPSRHV